jgi:diguanylate cyclase (GGDEF)-like protein/PAS domain S-box-containing protein
MNRDHSDDSSVDSSERVPFEQVLARLSDAFITVNREWRLAYLNPAGEEAFGQAAADLIGSSMWDIFVDVIGTEREMLYRDAMDHGIAIGYCGRFGPDDLWFDLRLLPFADGIRVYFRDVTAQRRTVLRLLASETRYRHLVEQVPAVIYSQQSGIGQPLTYVSPYIEELTGYSPDEFVRDRSLWTRLVHPADLGLVYAADRHAGDPQAPYRAEYRITTRHGDTRWLADEAISVPDPLTGQMHWQGVLRDITPLKDVQQELEQQAHRDPLTGLGNRTALDVYLKQFPSTSAEPHEVALLFIDLDRFKLINDAYGHDAGDQILRAIAHRLETYLDHAGPIIRFGGDEFVAVLPDTRADEVTRIAEELVQLLHEPIVVDSFDIVMGCSIGVALGVPEAGTRQLLRHAGLALQQAKALGRDQVARFTSSFDLASEHLVLISELRRALERDDLELVYQPVLDCRSGKLVTVEALIRWRHPERGTIPPDQFLPLVEESSLMVEIGDWVVAKACHQLCLWQEQLGSGAPPEVSVNVAVRQLYDPQFAVRVFGMLETHGLEAHRLRLELSERTDPAGLRSAVEVLEVLVQGGVRLSLDDFGAGNSSLVYFRTVRADDLKLDRSFVEFGGGSLQNAAILTSITSLGHALGLTVTAEGVETEEQFKVIQAAGCDRVQGYLIGYPMSAEDLGDWVVRRELPMARYFRAVEEDGESPDGLQSQGQA